MANKTKKSAAQAAAEQAASQQQAPAQENHNTGDDLNMNTFIKAMKSGAMSQDAKAITANLIQKRWVEGENIPDGIREGAGVLVDAFLGDIIVTSFANGSDVFSMIVARDEKKYLAVKAAMAEQGIALPDFKMLPAPSKEELEARGIKLLPTQAAVVTVKEGDVDKKAIEQKKKENEAVAKAVENPAEITNNEQLKASLTAMLVKPIAEGVDRPDARVQRTIKFYRGYLTIQANKAEDKAAAVNAVKEKSMTEMLNEISEIVGPCPFALSGTAYFLRKRAAETGMPISPYCLYRRSAVPGTDGTVDDQYVADIVRILLIWSCNSKIAGLNQNIKEAERLITKNEKIVKENKAAGEVKTAKAAIKTWNENIDKWKAEIAQLELIITETTNPSSEVVDNLVENYNGDEKSENYALAHRIVDDIMKTYYPTVDRTKVAEDVMLANAQQRAGIILNMFRDPLAQNISYSVANLTEMVEVEAEEEKAEDAKN